MMRVIGNSLFILLFLPHTNICIVATDDVDYNPFETAAKLNASLQECYKNHATIYPEKQAEGETLGACPYYFERDTGGWYWCRDKSCALSHAINVHQGQQSTTCTNSHDGYVAPEEDSFYLGANFITEDKAPEEIPCGRVLHDQSERVGDGRVACEQGDDWAKTPINNQQRNFDYVDFEVPSYQSNSCCSSVARLEFSGRATMGSTNIHNPWADNTHGNAQIQILCNVRRKSLSGNSCGNGMTWEDFQGTGVCGVQYTNDGGTDITSWANDNGVTIETHPTYCSEENLQRACDTWTEASRSMDRQEQLNLPCDSDMHDMYQMTCPAQTNFTVQSAVIGPPLSNEKKGQCRACHAVYKAFSGFPCSSRQAEFVDKTSKEFRVCRSACDVLFDTCGPPTHRGGMFVRTVFDSDAGTFPADYSDSTSMCHAMWHPHEESIWAMENFSLVVVDDSVDGHQGCVALERLIADFHFDSQNFIFDYEGIRNGEGFCSTEDPLYDKSAPCSDLEESVEIARRRLNGETSERATGGNSMYARGDISRSVMIAQGWPWEDTTDHTMLIIIVSAVVGIVLLLVLVVVVVVVMMKKKGGKRDNGEKSLEMK